MKELKQITVTITSPSGGCGVSTMSKELCIWFSRLFGGDKRLRICYADMHAGSGAAIPLLGLSDCRYCLSDLVKDMRTWTRESSNPDPESMLLNTMTWRNLEKYVSYDRIKEVYVLPSSKEAISSAVNSTEARLILEALSKNFDLLIADTPTVTPLAPITAGCMESSDKILFLVRNDADGIESMLRMRKDLIDAGLSGKISESAKMALLMTPAKDSYMKVKEIEEYLGFPVLCKIPYYQPAWTFNNSCSQIAHKGSPVEPAVRSIAGWIAPELNVNTRR